LNRESSPIKSSESVQPLPKQLKKPALAGFFVFGEEGTSQLLGSCAWLGPWSTILWL